MTDPSLIEQVFVHTSIPSLIEPLREFLDSWTIDEDEENGCRPQPHEKLTGRTPTDLRTIQFYIILYLLLCTSFWTGECIR